VICNEEDTDGRARVTRDEERVLPVERLQTSKCVKVAVLMSGSRSRCGTIEFQVGLWGVVE